MSENVTKPRVFKADDPALAMAPPPSSIETDPLSPELTDLQRPMRRFGRFWTVFWGAVIGLIGLTLGTAAYDFAAGLITRNTGLGWTALGLMAIVIIGFLVFFLREIAGLLRFQRIDELRAKAERAWDTDDRAKAEDIRGGMIALYRARPEMDAARISIDDRVGDSPDADALLTLIERETLKPLDAQALDAVKQGARRVAVTTALLPVGLLDAAAVLYLNVKMVRQIAEVYGGRAGWLGSWRLFRQIAFHLAATGAIALGDDLLGAVLGGGVLAKLSRRAGEGLLNGALTARIGVAAMEVSRPMPYRALPQPSIKKVAAAALKQATPQNRSAE